MEEIKFEDIKDGDRLRVFMDPGNTDLDYVDGTARVFMDILFLHVEKDYWIEGSSNLTGKDLRIGKVYAERYRYFRI